MNDNNDTSEEDGASSDDASLRAKLSDDGYKPNADGIKWGPVQPKVLVQGAYKVIRTAAERAREITGRSR